MQTSVLVHCCLSLCLSPHLSASVIRAAGDRKVRKRCVAGSGMVGGVNEACVTLLYPVSGAPCGEIASVTSRYCAASVERCGCVAPCHWDMCVTG